MVQFFDYDSVSQSTRDAQYEGLAVDLREGQEVKCEANRRDVVELVRFPQDACKRELQSREQRRVRKRQRRDATVRVAALKEPDSARAGRFASKFASTNSAPQRELPQVLTKELLALARAAGKHFRASAYQRCNNCHVPNVTYAATRYLSRWEATRITTPLAVAVWLMHAAALFLPLEAVGEVHWYSTKSLPIFSLNLRDFQPGSVYENLL